MQAVEFRTKGWNSRPPPDRPAAQSQLSGHGRQGHSGGDQTCGGELLRREIFASGQGRGCDDILGIGITTRIRNWRRWVRFSDRAIRLRRVACGCARLHGVAGLVDHGLQNEAGNGAQLPRRPGRGRCRRGERRARWVRFSTCMIGLRPVARGCARLRGVALLPPQSVEGLVAKRWVATAVEGSHGQVLPERNFTELMPNIANGISRDR